MKKKTIPLRPSRIKPVLEASIKLPELRKKLARHSKIKPHPTEKSSSNSLSNEIASD